MTTDEWKLAIAEALDPDCNVQTDRKGLTPYDYLRRSIEECARANDTNALLSALMETGSEHREEQADWWLSYANLFDALIPLSQRDRLRISRFAIENMPKNLEARATLLRLLAYIGCEFDWSAVEALDRVTEAAPLTVIDALVFASEFDRAGALLSRILEEGKVTPEDHEKMMTRWEQRLDPNQLARLRNSISFGGHRVDVANFIDKFRERSANWEPVLDMADA